LEGEASGVLLGLFFGGSFGFGQRARASALVFYANFDAEALLMVGAALGGEDVVGLAGSVGLEVLLQGGFVIADGAAEGVAALQGKVEIGKSRFNDVFFDEGAGGIESAVEVEGGDDSFQGVGEKSWLSAAPTLLFAAAKKEQRAEVDSRGYLTKVASADERRAETGQFALAGSWEAAKERFGDDEAKDRVPHELELLVVGGGIGEGLGVGLVGERAVGESPGQKIGPLKEMIEQRRSHLLLLQLCRLFVARRHRTPLRFTLPDRCSHVRMPCLVWGWRTICVFLGFSARVERGVVGFIWGGVLDFGRNEGLFDAFFGSGLCIGLGVGNGEGGLIFS